MLFMRATEQFFGPTEEKENTDKSMNNNFSEGWGNKLKTKIYISGKRTIHPVYAS